MLASERGHTHAVGGRVVQAGGAGGSDGHRTDASVGGGVRVRPGRHGDAATESPGPDLDLGAEADGGLAAAAGGSKDAGPGVVARAVLGALGAVPVCVCATIPANVARQAEGAHAVASGGSGGGALAGAVGGLGAHHGGRGDVGGTHGVAAVALGPCGGWVHIDEFAQFFVKELVYVFNCRFRDAFWFLCGFFGTCKRWNHGQGHKNGGCGQ